MSKFNSFFYKKVKSFKSVITVKRFKWYLNSFDAYNSFARVVNAMGVAAIHYFIHGVLLVKYLTPGNSGMGQNREKNQE